MDFIKVKKGKQGKKMSLVKKDKDRSKTTEILVEK